MNCWGEVKVEFEWQYLIWVCFSKEIINLRGIWETMFQNCELKWSLCITTTVVLYFQICSRLFLLFMFMRVFIRVWGNMHDAIAFSSIFLRLRIDKPLCFSSIFLYANKSSQPFQKYTLCVLLYKRCRFKSQLIHAYYLICILCWWIVVHSGISTFRKRF